MQLNYARKANGLYVLSRNDIEDIATLILEEYYPQNLIYPIPLNTIGLLEEHLGLTVKNKYIGTFESGILGLIVMNDEAEIPSYDDMYKPTILQETYGTVIISKQLSGKENMSRRRYTEVHEGSHFILHSDYYKNTLNNVANRSNNLFDYIACRRVELYKTSTNNNSSWAEWQADTLAAALLMPKAVFYSFVKSVFRENGITGNYIVNTPYVNKKQVHDIISQIAERFNVSYRAAQIRMIHLGLIVENSF